MVEKSNSYGVEQEIQNIDFFPGIQQEKNKLKENIEVPKDYGKTFLDYLTEYPTTKEKIESYLQEPETIETRSLKIENIWGEFAFGALDPKLQETIKNNPTLLQNMKTGLSLYFSDRLNNLSQSQLKDVSQVGNSMSGLLSKAGDLMGVFKNLSSFKEQMSAITYMTEGMDIYSKNLSSDENNNIASLEAFQSPEGFVRLLKKHTLTPGIQRPASFGSFDDYFNIDQQASINSADIITKLADSYNDNAHTLMTKVSNLGPKVLESRTALKNTFGELYDQVSQIFGLFNDGKPLSEIIKGSRIEKPLNFISSILGFGSLGRYEARNNIKNNTQKLPDSQKKGLLQAIDYVEHNDSTKVSENFTKIFDQAPQDLYTTYNITKETITQQLPDEDILKIGIKRALGTNDSFFIDPSILRQLGLENNDQYYTKDASGKIILNPVNLSGYQTLIKDNIDNITKKVWLGEKGLLQPEKIMKIIQEGKTKSHISSYLLSGLSFPDYPADIINSGQNTKDKEESLIENNIEITNGKIDIQKIKDGIFANESKHEKDPYKANNPTSSAIGKYQFLWNTRNKKIKQITGLTTIQEYINNPTQQEKFMDYVITKEYLPKANEYASIYPERKIPEIIMLIHFKGVGGALTWIKDKKDNTMANNISIDKYIDKFQKEYYS